MRALAAARAGADTCEGRGNAAEALATSARPGHSEHQLGTAMVVTGLHDGPPWDADDWAATKAAQWRAANAWRYG